LVLYGKLVKDLKVLKETFVENDMENVSYHDMLEKCLIDLCRKLDIPAPIWLKKNTAEFAGYHKTFFSSEQFIEKVKFDKFIIEVIL
jgi:hypothetical protein